MPPAPRTALQTMWSNIVGNRQLQPATDAALHMAAFSTFKKTGYWNPPTCPSSAGVYSTHKLLRGKQNSMKGKEIDALFFGMLYNSYLQDVRNIMFPKHFSLWNIYPGFAEAPEAPPPFLFDLSFLLPLHKELILELGLLRHQMGWKLVPFPASSEALNLTVCSHILGLTEGAVFIEHHDSGAPLLYHLTALPALATLYTSSPTSNSHSKSVREIQNSIHT